MKQPSPPNFSFGSRTPYNKRDNFPGPDSYHLPAMLGSKVVGKCSAASFSMTGRSKIGSFHEDLQKVYQLHNLLMYKFTVKFVFTFGLTSL